MFFFLSLNYVVEFYYFVIKYVRIMFVLGYNNVFKVIRYYCIFFSIFWNKLVKELYGSFIVFVDI